MSKFCPLCGSELVDGICPNQKSHFKQMCLNCEFCKADEDGETYRCVSEGNMNNALKKIKESVPDLGYEIQLKPLPLKKPTLKCALWSPDRERILNALMPFLTGGEKITEKKAE